jgi:hypothetical protein
VGALLGFAIDGSLGNPFSGARLRLKRYQAELPLEGPGPGEQLLVVPSGRVNTKRLRVDLVDSHVDVLVLGVAVTHSDVLMFGKSQSIDEFVDNLLELPSFEAPIIGVK